jgi:hypothetical protein
MNRFIAGLGLFTLLGLAPEAQARRSPETLTVSGKQLLINGQPFTAKGVNYHPVPRTGSSNWPDDWTMNRAVAFSDLAKMKEMGVNVIRVYALYDRIFGNWDEANDPSSDPSRVDSTVVANYRAILDEADRLGIYVIMNYYLPTVDYRSGAGMKFSKDARTRHKLRFRNLINVFKNRTDFPMILMWAFGNENNFEWNRGGMTSAQAFDFYGEAVREADTQADSAHPYTVVIGDNAELDIHNTSLLGRAPYVDVWSINMYNTEQGFKNIIQGYSLNKPLLFTEFGYDACQHNKGCDTSNAEGRGTSDAQQQQASFFQSRWQNAMLPNLSAKSTSNKLLGGVVFEWNDEWWKDGAGPRDVHNTGGFANANLTPDCFMNEEWFGLSTALTDTQTSGRFYRSAYSQLKSMWAQ